MRIRRLILGSIAAISLMSLLPLSAATASQPSPPTGVTGIALDGRVELAWQPTSGATSYAVYRGNTASSIATRVTPAGGIITTTFTDTSVANGQTYYYVVHAVASGTESADSLVVQATPAGRSCTAGNPIVVENCFPGSTGWRIVNAGSVANGGIEGYATATSINRGDSVDLKVKSGTGSTFRAEIYRSGYYGGAGARLFSVIQGVPGVLQPACNKDNPTGLIDCSNWSTSLTLTTTASWPTGVYMIRIVRDDSNSDNQILLTVRDDSSHSQLLYGVGYSTFQAYNNYGGKSLYDSNSFGNTTVAGTARAVKVSFDRPFEQPRSGQRDWYTNDGYPMVYWLESQGYDVALHLEHRPRGTRQLGAEPPGVHLSRPRRVLLGGHAQRARTRSRRRREPLLLGLQRRLLEDPVRGQPVRRRSQPRAGLLQEHAERAGRSERYSDHDVARSERRKQAGERADRRDVHGRRR